MKTFAELQAIVDELDYKEGWSFRFEPLDEPICANCRRKLAHSDYGWTHVGYGRQGCNDLVVMARHYFLQTLVKTRPDEWNDGIEGEGRGRKWLISPHMTESEIVLTAFKACLTHEEHECREAFRYHGQAICQPHPDMGVLLTSSDLHDVRTPMPEPFELDDEFKPYFSEEPLPAAVLEEVEKRRSTD